VRNEALDECIRVVEGHSPEAFIKEIVDKILALKSVK
jgi:hypothetical protein